MNFTLDATRLVQRKKHFYRPGGKFDHFVILLTEEDSVGLVLSRKKYWRSEGLRGDLGPPDLAPSGRLSGVGPVREVEKMPSGRVVGKDSMAGDWGDLRGKSLSSSPGQGRTKKVSVVEAGDVEQEAEFPGPTSMGTAGTTLPAAAVEAGSADGILKTNVLQGDGEDEVDIYAIEGDGPNDAHVRRKIRSSPGGGGPSPTSRAGVRFSTSDLSPGGQAAQENRPRSGSAPPGRFDGDRTDADRALSPSARALELSQTNDGRKLVGFHEYGIDNRDHGNRTPRSQKATPRDPDIPHWPGHQPKIEKEKEKQMRERRDAAQKPLAEREEDKNYDPFRQSSMVGGRGGGGVEDDGVVRHPRIARVSGVLAERFGIKAGDGLARVGNLKITQENWKQADWRRPCEVEFVRVAEVGKRNPVREGHRVCEGKHDSLCEDLHRTTKFFSCMCRV